MKWIELIGLNSPFFLRASLAALGCSFCTSIIGSYIVYRRLSNLSAAISHGLVAGLGLGIYLQKVANLKWISPEITCLGFAILSGLFLSLAGRESSASQEAMATAIWVSGSGVGSILLSRTPSSSQSLSRYMLGNILWVSNAQIRQVFILSLFVFLFGFLFHKQILCRSVDEDLARLHGIRVTRLDFLLMTFISITVSILTIIFGGLFVMAFLHLPAMISEKISKRTILSSMIGTLFISVSASILGLFLSLHTNTPPTGATALLLASLYAVAFLYSKLVKQSARKSLLFQRIPAAEEKLND
ncbi:metal ABC transporter permease [Candidatus Similichlamydia epinepheli]|uniref:metal ABC transporter permease n=1 Tax=Candidatus Similichlamydia epinepheli TaxID=1903953 RepID=UPI000D343724|nr:iron chelate uptake ABC transporter family permease subunit [Candidatus Similichlamydia epinepheli]